MKKISKKLICLILAIIILQKIYVSAAAATPVNLAPTDLKVNMLSEAYGIPAADPTFSWVMNDTQPNQVQTAYEIIISTSLNNINANKADVMDTGMVVSAESSYVKINSLKLSDNSLYYWKVRVWDSAGYTSEYSRPSAMATAVGSQWAGTNTIWAGDSNDYANSNWDNYDIELDMQVNSAAAGINFRDTNGTNFYMWQFNTTNNTLNPFICTNNRYNSLGAVNLTKSGINLKPKTYFHVKIVLENDLIITYINNKQIDKRSLTTFSTGTIGFRNGINESASYKNVRVYKKDSSSVNKYLYYSQFAWGSNPFSGGSVSKGTLTLGSSQNIILMAAPSENDWKNYSLSLDMNITYNTTGINFRVTNGGSSYYKWKFDSGQDKLIPQVCLNGKTYQLSSVNLSSANIHLNPQQYYNIKIVALNNSISTYVNNNLVDTRTITYLSSGFIGFQNGAKESGTYKNIRVYSLDDSGQLQKTLYCDSFASGNNTFSGGKVYKGTLSVGRSTMVCLKSIKAKKDFVFLRNEFNITDTASIQKAVVSVSATSSNITKLFTYSLYLNGSSVGVGPCVPIGKEVRYNTYDVTSMLKNGANVIGSLNYALTGKQFLMQMTVYYKDGTSKILLNSGRDYQSWRSLDGTTIFGENNSVGTVYYTQAAENIDATLYPFGWDNTGFDDSKWQSVSCIGAIAKNNLVPSPESNVGRYENSVATVVNKGNGDYFIDLGKEVVGGLSLTTTSGRVAQITVRCGEEKIGNTGVLYSLRTGNCYEEKWTLKQGMQTISNSGIKTFRYVEILNSPVTITKANISSVSIRQDFDDDASSFISSNMTLNNIYNLTKYSVKETNQLLQVDSQTRERTAYQGDALINSLASFAVDSDITLPQYTTEYLNYNGTWPAEYKLMSVMLTWNDYMYTGNLDIIKDYYSKLKSDRLYDNLFSSKYNLIKCANSNKGNIDSVLVDWPVNEQDGYDTKDAEYNTVLNSVAYGAYIDMAQMATVLEKADDAMNYRTKAAKIKKAMMTRLYNSSMGAFSDGLTANGTRIRHYSQHASAFALAFGIASDPATQKSVAAYLGRSGVFKTSVYGAMFVLSGLYNADAGITAMQLLTSNDIRSWNHMIKKVGATITTEAWDASLKGNMTFSHPWGTAPASQIMSGLFGIQPLAAGFSSFQIKYQPGSLSYASIKVPTVRGSIETSFYATNEFTSSITIPGNTRARVYIPTSNNFSNLLMVDGTKTIATRVGNYLLVELGSGTHNVSLIRIKFTDTKAVVKYIKKEEWWESVDSYTANKTRTLVV